MGKNNGALLKPAKNEFAFVKIGMMGFPKSGKTFTATSISIGLVEYLKEKRPVGFFDTENGSDFMIKRFKEAGVELLVYRSRAFIDLLKVVREAEESCSVLIIDSISHVWKELIDIYCEQKKITRMAFHHWLPIKKIWSEYTDLYLKSRLHIIMCGRAGYEYGYTEDEEGVKELQKTGVRMKADTDMGYEPSLLIQMERHRGLDAKTTRQAIIYGDKAFLMDGQVFVNPTFETFLPHIESLNIGGKHTTPDLTRTSAEMIKTGDNNYDRQVKRQILVEKIDNEITLAFPGRGGDDKGNRIKLVKTIFGTSSWREVERMDIERLEKGLAAIAKVKKPVGAS